MHFNLVVIGSGLSGLSFIDSYLEKNKKINVISPEFKKFQNKSKSENSHLYNDKNLPPQMKNSENNIRDYFLMNNFSVSKNSNIMGTLEFGGLSNYWGLQIDQNILSDTKCLSKKNNIKLQKSFIEIAKKAKFIGEFSTKNEKFENDFKVDNSFGNLLKMKNIDGFKITKPMLAISGKKLKKEKKVNLNLIKERINKITAKNYYNKFIKKKNIHFHNYAVKKIFIEKKKIALVCENKSKKKIFYAKKVVFACGTLVTTKLVMDFLKIKKEVKIKEHPRLLSLFLSKYKIKNYLNFMPSQMQIRNDSKSKSFLVDFRPGNKFIINAAVKIYKFLKPFEFLLNYFKNYMIFSNILLGSEYSNLFIKLNNNSKAFIYSKSKEIRPTFKNIHKKIFKLLCNKNLIYPVYKNFFSGNGSAYHYFGTIPITNKKIEMSVNNFCQLKKFPNIYIADGSVFDFKINKYPLGIIMANARRIAKEIK